MKVSSILDYIDDGHMALPEFQRGYVWNRDQVKGLMYSMYRRHPVGSLLVWATQSEQATHRGSGELAPGVVKLLLDGQQRMTSLYGIIRGKEPRFFDGNSQSFTGLRFHLESEVFEFYAPIKMEGDPLWIDVSKVMTEGVGPFINQLSSVEDYQPKLSLFINRLSTIHGIKDIDLHIEEVTGSDKTIDVVVELFNLVNSGGTKLSSGDLALAKICANWPEARDTMKVAIKKWHDAGFSFTLDWLLRNVNTIITGEAKFNALHNVRREEVQQGLELAVKAIETILTTISGRLGLDHDRVLFGKYAFPVMTRYLHKQGGKFDTAGERDKLLYWYLHSSLWGRFSGSTESYINADLEALEAADGGIDSLLSKLRLWQRDLNIQPDHFTGWSLGARFYPLLYLLTRMGQAQDWSSGLPLKKEMLGHLNRLEVHHIFPKAYLYDHGYTKSEVNAVANFCFLTQGANLEIMASPPKEYFLKIENKHPGALASQWIPMDEELWQIERYPDFLKARRKLLAEAANRYLGDLLQGELPTMDIDVKVIPAPKQAVDQVPGRILCEEEESLLLGCMEWLEERGLPVGELAYELVDDESNELIAQLDLAWPSGLQPGLSRPIAVLLDEGPETFAAANRAGFQYFTSIDDFKDYVDREILAVDSE